MNSQAVFSLSTSSKLGEISRLLSAAVVSPRFCKLLLSDPETALRVGYQSESFHLSPEEKLWVLSTRAENLSDFAAEMINNQNRSQRVRMPALALGDTASRMYQAS
jgi:hypothetical protein